ncbi:30S ribosomal protein S6 [Opitutaceae bacterium TAV4]|uniref:30S ribosomal protein S6 n=1 Tax=Geminisphaera colitermitum TaxID=1148786 RepID=UPI000158CC54|nr:30S ribosomal protein S6 [Geminisphaera colitermitum]RRJ95899.1 30S ribosomal protein S6 [Opitutaceae bacterium TAV4]RRK00052.1 30S ribosomal protein S6 [Opitutaceae bacterium TAV3]
MSTTNRNYRATFIIDNSGKEDTIEQILEGVKNDITAVEAQVTAVEDVGRKDFVRVTNPKRVAGHYVHVTFSGPASAPAALKERLRLNHSVYRTFVESI